MSLVTFQVSKLFCVRVYFQLTREYFSRELKRHYQGHNNSDVLTSTWNAIMTTVKHWFYTHLLFSPSSPPLIDPSLHVSVYSSTAVVWVAQRTSTRASSGSSAPLKWSQRPVARGTVTPETSVWSSVWAAAWCSDTTRSYANLFIQLINIPEINIWWVLVLIFKK